jgi:hypothetical protein
MTNLLILADLRPFVDNLDVNRAQAIIEDLLSLAVVRVPALLGPLSVDQQDAARGVLREQALRRYSNGAGDVQQQTAGPFTVTVDSRSSRVPILSDHALNRLRQIVGVDSGKAFSVDTTPAEADSLS